jgi:signal transduction histidine kinase
MNQQQFSLEEISRNRWTYLKMVYGLCGFNTMFYILRFNYEFKASEYNWILFPVWFVMMLVPPAFMIFGKHYKAAALSICLTTTLLTLILIFLSGGYEAPGIFWLAAVPVVLGMLTGVSGALIGYGIFASSLAFFYFCHRQGIGPNVITKYGDYTLEKIINVVAFTTFSAFTAIVYRNREQNFNNKLIEKSSNVENLLRVLLHDIANTLSSMTYNLIRLKAEGGTSAVEFEKIEKSIEDISTLLVQVRHLRSIKDGKSSMMLKPISLPVILNAVYELTADLALQKGLKLNWDMSREKISVTGDRTILSNVVILNVINNAIKFSRAGSHIDVTTYIEKDMAVISVRDHGIGIPLEVLQHIFSLYHSTTRPGTAGEKGTGYGMPLAKEYIQMMGGDIEITSSELERKEMKRGTLVKIKIPLVKTEHAETIEVSPVKLPR